MYKINIDYSDIKYGAKTVQQDIGGERYIFTVRCPLFDDKYYIDIYNQEGTPLVQGQVIQNYQSLLGLVKHNTTLEGMIAVMDSSSTVNNTDLIYPMLGNGNEIYYISKEEVGA